MGLGALLDREVRHGLGICVFHGSGRADGGDAVTPALSLLTQFPWAYEVAIEAARNGIVVCDGTGTIVYANPRAATILGYESSDLLGEPIERLLDPESRGTLAAERSRIWHDPNSQEGCATWELSGLCKSGALVPVEVTLTTTTRGNRRMVIASLLDITERRRLEQSQAHLERALAEVKRLRDQLSTENVQLRQEVKTLQGPRMIAAESHAIRNVLTQVESVARTDATVLLQGETGCGKEVIAQAIHDQSDRRDRPMVRVNCAAIPTALIESELFGRERGAYTGALSRQIGRFELASGTTIFLDEVGDLPLEAQAKLLRVLQDKTLERLGSVRPIHVDVRVIAATNRDLQRAVVERTFREDLFYRLNVFPITVPPLRERPEDIPVLAWTFIDEFSKSFNKPIDSISRESLAILQRHTWPGNVRELRNVIERAVIVTRSPRLVIGAPRSTQETNGHSRTMAAVQSEHIRAVLKSVNWRIRGAGGAAEMLGMKPTTLESRMAKLGIRRPE